MFQHTGETQMFQHTGETQILLLVLWESLRFEQDMYIKRLAILV